MTRPPTPFQNSDIDYIFDCYPTAVRKKCLQLRELIFDVAKEHPVIGPIEETLRWGEPSYIPSETKSGSMVRLHHYASKPFDFALYFICSTSLVDSFRELYPECFSFDGNRAITFMLDDELPIAAIKDCIYRAFTYNIGAKE